MYVSKCRCIGAILCVQRSGNNPESWSLPLSFIGRGSLVRCYVQGASWPLGYCEDFYLHLLPLQEGGGFKCATDPGFTERDFWHPHSGLHMCAHTYYPLSRLFSPIAGIFRDKLCSYILLLKPFQAVKNIRGYRKDIVHIHIED